MIRGMNFFSHVPKEPEDPIYGLQVTFKKDLRPDKLNLSIGFLLGENGPYRFSAVEKAAAKLFEASPGYQYLPIDGLPAFREAACDIVFGEKVGYTAQTVGGTAALHVGGKFLLEQATKHILISNPTWVNHKKLFETLGFTVSQFDYKVHHGELDLTPMLAAIEKMPEGSAIILQASCHNPTGIDPTDEQFKKISAAIKKKRMIAFFDLAYQGLGKGVEEDVRAIRFFLREGHEFLVATSFSKNFGLYSERVGALSIVAPKEHVEAISSQIRKIIRSIYSSPSSYGAHLVATVWNDPELRSEWRGEIEALREDLEEKRSSLALELTRGDKNAILKSHGLFAMTGLSFEEVLKLRDEQAIYLCDDGRINIAAIKKDEITRILQTL